MTTLFYTCTEEQSSHHGTQGPDFFMTVSSVTFPVAIYNQLSSLQFFLLTTENLQLHHFLDLNSFLMACSFSKQSFNLNNGTVKRLFSKPIETIFC